MFTRIGDPADGVPTTVGPSESLIKIAGCENPNRHANIVFVHGLGGHAWTTWHPRGLQDRAFWPQWLADEEPTFGVWSYAYEAAASGWKGRSMPLFDRASNLLEWLKAEGLSDRPLFFVAHSLGGLLVKYLLESAHTYDEAIAQQIKGVVFVATPHTGAHLASLLDKLHLIAKTTVSVEELKAHDPALRKANEWYRENYRRIGVLTKVFYETQPIKNVLVVDEDSANPAITGVKPVGLSEDHLSIARPSSPKLLICRATRQFIKERLDEAAILSQIGRPNTASGKTSLSRHFAETISRSLEQKAQDEISIGLTANLGDYGKAVRQLDDLASDDE